MNDLKDRTVQVLLALIFVPGIIRIIYAAITVGW